MCDRDYLPRGLTSLCLSALTAVSEIWAAQAARSRQSWAFCKLQRVMSWCAADGCIKFRALGVRPSCLRHEAGMCDIPLQAAMLPYINGMSA